jgi:hypothetical protein
MTKLTLKDMTNVHDALNLLYMFKAAKLSDVDLTAIFKKQPTAAQIKKFDTATKSTTFVQALIFQPERWAKEFNTELTPEYLKFIKKIRSKQK